MSPSAEKSVSGRRGVRVPWPVDVLVAIGYAPHDAEPLAKHLPHVAEDAIPLVLALAHPREEGWTPAGYVVYLTHDLSEGDALRLAQTGRDVFGLVSVLDAVGGSNPHWLWHPRVMDVALAWATCLTVPHERLCAYIEAGVSPEEAQTFEAQPGTRPSADQLACLAALRGPVSGWRRSSGEEVTIVAT